MPRKVVYTIIIQQRGFFPIIDQGQKYIADYIDIDTDIYSNVPEIVFGDHTRAIMFVDFPVEVAGTTYGVIRVLGMREM